MNWRPNPTHNQEDQNHIDSSSFKFELVKTIYLHQQQQHISIEENDEIERCPSCLNTFTDPLSLKKNCQIGQSGVFTCLNQCVYDNFTIRKSNVHLNSCSSFCRCMIVDESTLHDNQLSTLLL